jgi:broad specificity phosphatase PhoE
LATVFFITHPDVTAHRDVPPSEWPLAQRGRDRMRQFVKSERCITGIRSVFVSGERKATDAAWILVDGLRLGGYSVHSDLGEVDRTATGFLDKAEFDAAVDLFFALPNISIRGWESGAVAQKRIIAAVEQVISQTPTRGDVAIIGHGISGALLYCHLAELPISRRHFQPTADGGKWFSFDRVDRKLLQGWRSIDTVGKG